MGLFKDNKNESRQFFESDIQPDILEEKKEMLSESEQLGSDIDRVINVLLISMVRWKAMSAVWGN